jgi:hypothetical protein
MFRESIGASLDLLVSGLHFGGLKGRFTDQLRVTA